MTRNELVARAKAILAEAYEEAAEMIVLYLETHPSEQLQSLCKEIDPDNWNALRQRVQRAQEARRASVDAESSRSRALHESRVRHTRSALKIAEPETIADLLDDPDIRQNIAAAQRVRELRTENQTGIPARNPASGPTFISLVLKVNGWLDELVGMVERGEAEIPDEFSAQSLVDMGRKVMALQELVDDARETEGVLSRD